MSKRGQPQGPWLRLSEIDLHDWPTPRLARRSVPCQNWPAPWFSPNRGSAMWCSPVERAADLRCPRRSEDYAPRTGCWDSPTVTMRFGSII